MVAGAAETRGVLAVAAEADAAATHDPVDPRAGRREVAAAGAAAAVGSDHPGRRRDAAEELGVLVHVAGDDDRRAGGPQLVIRLISIPVAESRCASRPPAELCVVIIQNSAPVARSRSRT